MRGRAVAAVDFRQNGSSLLHTTARAARDVQTQQMLHPLGRCPGRIVRRPPRLGAHQLPATHEQFPLDAIGQEAVVPDAEEAAGQHVLQLERPLVHMPVADPALRATPASQRAAGNTVRERDMGFRDRRTTPSAIDTSRTREAAKNEVRSCRLDAGKWTCPPFVQRSRSRPELTLAVTVEG